MTAAEADERALAAEVAASVLDRPVTSCTPLPGLGSVNQIFVAHAADTELIVRLRSDPAAAAEYRKERWCIATAVARGVPGPQVLAVGQRGRTGFMVQRRLPGRNGAFVSDAQAVWHALGRFARSIHGIAPAGFGETLADEHAGRFAAPSIQDSTAPGPASSAITLRASAPPTRSARLAS